MMKRRWFVTIAFLALLAGAAVSWAVDPPGTVVKTLTALPKGLVEVEIPDGTTVEWMVPAATSSMVIKVKPTFLLTGLFHVWRNQPASGSIQPTYSVSDYTSLGIFPDLQDSLVWSTRYIARSFVYRHPATNRGNRIRAEFSGALYMELKPGLAGGSLPPLEIELVELDVSPTSVQDLDAIAAEPLVIQVLKSWTFPGGVGTRNIALSVPWIDIPWNARAIGLRRKTVVNATVEVRLHAGTQGLVFVCNNVTGSICPQP